MRNAIQLDDAAIEIEQRGEAGGLFEKGAEPGVVGMRDVVPVAGHGAGVKTGGQGALGHEIVPGRSMCATKCFANLTIALPHEF